MSCKILLLSLIAQGSCRYQLNPQKTILRACASCPGIDFDGDPDLIQIYKTKLRLDCIADYPVEWLLYFHEEDNPASHIRYIPTYRFAENMADPSTHRYKTDLYIESSQTIRLFPNFTCRGSENTSLITRVVLNGNDSFVSLSTKSTPNDYKFLGNKEVCETHLIQVLYDTEGFCYNCIDASGDRPDPNNLEVVLRTYSVNCETLFHCNAIFQHVANNPHCFREYKTERKPLTVPQRVLTLNFCPQKHRKDASEPSVAYCVTKLSVLGVAQVVFYSVRDLRKPIHSRIAYHHWREVKPEDMIEIFRNETDLATRIYEFNDTSVFCRVSKYYFAFFARFGVQWNGGELFYLSQDRNFVQSFGILSSSHKVSKWEGGYYELEGHFSFNRAGNFTIHCLAPVINSSEWVSDKITVLVHQTKFPEILNLGYSSPVKGNKLKTGENGRSLKCSFTGEPIPTIEWEYNGESTLPLGATVTTDGNVSVLNLPNVFTQLGGAYTCSARSFVGTSEETFIVEVEDPTVFNNWIWITTFSVSFALLVIGVVMLCRFRRIVIQQRETIRCLTEDEVEKFMKGEELVESTDNENPNIAVESMPYDSKLEISFDMLQIDFRAMLGSGEFGFVCKGHVVSNSDYQNEESAVVAVKTVKENVSVDYFMALLSEIKVMAHVGENGNIVSLLGACTENIRDRKVYIVVEYCEEGSLLGFLRQNRSTFQTFVADGIFNQVLVSNADTNHQSFDTRRLVLWSADIARGLQHVHEKRVIHGDLAARNVLLSGSLVAKISDFGLSRQLVGSGNYVKKTQVPLPWRHMSPESLQDRVFSTKSDVWAFGVTLWEIFCLGETPYGGANWSLEFMQDLKCGVRLNKPNKAPNEMYEYMLKAWEDKPEDRPVAHELLEVVRKLLEQLNVMESRIRGIL